MRISVAALALVPVLLIAACTTAPAGHARTPPPPAAQRLVDYVNSALDLMRAHS